MDVGVRISTTNPALAREFVRALNFWARILDMNWYEDNTSDCSIELVDGPPDIYVDGTFAQSQLPEWKNFQGWIAFDPRVPLTPTEMYYGSVHEIGHLLGLKHNPSATSVMYGEENDRPEWLDAADIISLAAHHKLRYAGVRNSVP
jgi:hypothetical protein